MTRTHSGKQELLDRAYEVAATFDRTYSGCSQGCFAGLQVVLDQRNPEADAAFRAMSSLAGGVARLGDGSCGAYLGAAAFISYLTGRSRDQFAPPGQETLDGDERSRRYGEQCAFSDDLVARLHSQFIAQYGTVTCSAIQRKLFGRPFFFNDSDERSKFRQANAAASHKCCDVVGSAARWTAEILLDAGVVSR